MSRVPGLPLAVVLNPLPRCNSNNKFQDRLSNRCPCSSSYMVSNRCSNPWECLCNSLWCNNPRWVTPNLKWCSNKWCLNNSKCTNNLCSNKWVMLNLSKWCSLVWCLNSKCSTPNLNNRCMLNLSNSNRWCTLTNSRWAIDEQQLSTFV